MCVCACVCVNNNNSNNASVIVVGMLWCCQVCMRWAFTSPTWRSLSSLTRHLTIWQPAAQQASTWCRGYVLETVVHELYDGSVYVWVCEGVSL